MNATQRKVLANLSEQLQFVIDELRNMAEDEGEKFSNLSEGLQASERGQKIEEDGLELEEIADELEGLLERLTEL